MLVIYFIFHMIKITATFGLHPHLQNLLNQCSPRFLRRCRFTKISGVSVNFVCCISLRTDARRPHSENLRRRGLRGLKLAVTIPD